MDKVTSLKKELPDGMTLIAELNNDPNYPGIQISLKGTDSDGANEILCIVEYNTDKPAGKNLCICVYTHDHDEPVYYESYINPEPDIDFANQAIFANGEYT